MNSNRLINSFPLIRPIIKRLHERGATVYAVGGAIRDMLLDLIIKDLDIEVHGLQPHELEHELSAFGNVLHVGSFFGVFKIEGLDIDWSLPRKDSAGRKPIVTVSPYLSITEALRRRDLTMNAMALNLITNELIDPFGGRDDIQAKRLRTPDPQFFIQDPLRFFRVMQFIGRFEMYPDKELQKLCETMDILHISRERIEAEFEKLFTQSIQPSRGIRWLHELNRLKEIMPELAATVNIEQNPHWHPEGDVFEHTMQVLDAIIEYASSKSEKIILAWAGICHDLGKATTTRVIENKIVSYGHEIEGVPLAQSLLKRFTRVHELIEVVSKLVRYHMMPGILVKHKSSDAAYKRLALKLAPQTNARTLIKLAYADRRGRNGASHIPLVEKDPNIIIFEEKIIELHLLDIPEMAILSGKDFLDVLEKGPLIGKAVKQAYKLQIEANIKDSIELKKRTLDAFSRSLKKSSH